jgi:hypothetical protein
MRHSRRRAATIAIADIAFRRAHGPTRIHHPAATEVAERDFARPGSRRAIGRHPATYALAVLAGQRPAVGGLQAESVDAAPRTVRSPTIDIGLRSVFDAVGAGRRRTDGAGADERLAIPPGRASGARIASCRADPAAAVDVRLPSVFHTIVAVRPSAHARCAGARLAVCARAAVLVLLTSGTASWWLTDASAAGVGETIRRLRARSSGGAVVATAAAIDVALVPVLDAVVTAGADGAARSSAIDAGLGPVPHAVLAGGGQTLAAGAHVGLAIQTGAADRPGRAAQATSSTIDVAFASVADLIGAGGGGADCQTALDDAVEEVVDRMILEAAAGVLSAVHGRVIPIPSAGPDATGVLLADRILVHLRLTQAHKLGGVSTNATVPSMLALHVGRPATVSAVTPTENERPAGTDEGSARLQPVAISAPSIKHDAHSLLTRSPPRGGPTPSPRTTDKRLLTAGSDYPKGPWGRKCQPGWTARSGIGQIGNALSQQPPKG